MAPRVAVIAGDGVGKEVVPEGVRVVTSLGLDFEFDQLPWGCEHLERTGRMMPADALGYQEEGDRVGRAIDAVCEDGRVLTGDLGGTASTREVGDALVRALG